VLRLPAPTSTTDFAAEYAILRELARVFGASASRRTPHNTTRSGLAELVAAQPQHGWLLTRWIDAPVLASAAGVSGKQLGRYLAMLHSQLQQATASLGELLPASITSHLVNSIVADLEAAELEVAQSEGSNRLRAHLDALSPREGVNQLCHIDLNPWNILYDQTSHPAVWTTLDWETLTIAPALFDLVALSDGYAYNQGYSTADTHKLAEQTFQSYCAVSDFEPNLAELSPLRELFWWREYAWAAARLTTGELGPAVLEDVQHQRRYYAALLAPKAVLLGLSLT